MPLPGPICLPSLVFGSKLPGLGPDHSSGVRLLRGCGINHSPNLRNPVGREPAELGVFANGALIRGDVHAVNLVVRDVTMHPLNLRAHSPNNAAMRDYIELTKPRITWLILMSTGIGYFFWTSGRRQLARIPQGHPSSFPAPHHRRHRPDRLRHRGAESVVRARGRPAHAAHRGAVRCPPAGSRRMARWPSARRFRWRDSWSCGWA
jgi:hypothetical protein